MVRRSLMLATMLTLAVAMGCTTTQKYMAGGAAVGAVGGGLWAAEEGILSAAEGAMVGAVTGATVMGLVGDMVDQNRTDEMKAQMQAEIDRLTAENADLRAKLAECERKLAEANARIRSLEQELADLRGRPAKRTEISLLTDVLFNPGSATLSDRGKQTLRDAASRLKSEFAGKFIMVEGHTDSDPIRHSSWKDNWELGSARALAVLRSLISDGGVEPARGSAATFAFYQPVATNDTKEGKAQNRRAVIVIYDEYPRAEKQGAAKAAPAGQSGERPAAGGEAPRRARRPAAR